MNTSTPSRVNLAAFADAMAVKLSQANYAELLTTRPSLEARWRSAFLDRRAYVHDWARRRKAA